MRAEIRSKLIDVATYDAEAKSLCLHMTNGERREFSGVPQSVFEKLLKARSPGQFYFDETATALSPRKRHARAFSMGDSQRGLKMMKLAAAAIMIFVIGLWAAVGYGVHLALL